MSDHPGYTSTPVVYRGPDVVDHFLESLRHERRLINTAIDCPVPMVMTPADIEDFAAATTCHICGKDGTRMVRDHDHLTGTYRGAAHNKCNLRLHLKGKRSKDGSNVEVPVVMHNLRGYDTHLIAPALGRHPGRINVIANNMTKYVSFSLGRLRFIDSLQFMSTSLEKLVANLPSDGFVNLEAHTDHTELLKRKGVFPYDHFDGPARLEETQLPPKSAFYSRLTETDISDADYAHAHEVWTTFGMTAFAEYHDLYMKTDVLLLADVFEQFCSTCMMHYGLDPAHYYTAPGLSWDAMLKMTEVELELLTDVDMHLFVESGIRGGVSMISGRHAVANNTYLPDYDSIRPTTHITYLDANNLYVRDVDAASHLRLPVAQSRGDRRAGHHCTTRRLGNRIHLGGGSRVPSAPPRPTQRLSASPREVTRHGGDALPLLAASARPARYRPFNLEARAELTTEDRIRHPPPQPSTVCRSGDEADRTPSRSRLLPVGMARTIHPVQHRATQESRQPVRGLFKMNEQRSSARLWRIYGSVQTSSW